MTPAVSPPWLGSRSSATSPGGSAPAPSPPWLGWGAAGGPEVPGEVAGGSDGSDGGGNDSRSL